MANNLAKEEPPKTVLSVPQIKVQQLKATHSVHLTHSKILNSSQMNNRSNINGVEINS